LFDVFQNAHGGKQMVGQLGHGDTAAYRIPKPVDAMHGIAVKQVACGDEFTACVTGRNSHMRCLFVLPPLDS